MSRNKRETNATMGYDAFLDIVANMVGILIILVVVLGSHSQEVTTKVQQEIEAQVAASRSEIISEPQEASMKINSDIQRLEHQVAVYDRELVSRQSERAAMLMVLQQAEAEWTKKQSEMEEKSRRSAELAGKRRELLTSLQELEAINEMPVDKPRKVFTLEHLPTPMAQTVFGEELHFRLKHGKLSVVPLQSLIEAIESEFQRLANSGAREGTRDGAVGPFRDYTANYEIRSSRAMVSRGGGTTTGVRVELVGLVVEPVRESLGEDFPAALGENSQLAYELAGRDPRSTTITVWVYPDSFIEFRRLKEHLFARGFATAARPLPEGHPISGSPQGSRSTAQ